MKEVIVDDVPELEEEDEEEMEDDEEEEESTSAKMPQAGTIGIPKDNIHAAAPLTGEPHVQTPASGDGPVVVDYRQASADRESITKMQNSLQHMLTILQTQQSEIKNLRSELQQQQQSNEAVEHLQSQLDQLEEALSSTVTGALTQHHNAQCILCSPVIARRPADFN